MRVPYIQRVKRPDGRVFLYFRKDGYREGPLQAADGTEALREEVAVVLSRLTRAKAALAPAAGTVGGMIQRYIRSAEFIALAVSTQKEYGRLAREIETDVGDVLLRDIDAVWVRELRDAWAPRGYKTTNDHIQVLKNALEPAVADGRLRADPFFRLKKMSPAHGREEPHPAWEDAEIEAFLELAVARGMPGLARAIALGRWGGFRRGTICRLPHNARTMSHDADGVEQRRLYWITEKRRVLCDKPEDARLTALLAATPNAALTIAYNKRGEPWKDRQLNQALDRLLVKLVEQGKTRPNLDLHGLRHARGLELAHAGASDAEIMAQLEHATDRAARIYRRQAQRRTLADAGQARVDNVVKLQTARKARNAT